MLVREANLADAGAIGEVHAEAWRVSHRDLFDATWLSTLVEQRRSRWTALSAREFASRTTLLAIRDDRIVAFACFGPHPDGPPDSELFDLYAHPTVWGRGVAATLLDSAWDMLRDNGYPRVRLWTVSGANRARHFYASFGFTESGRTRERDFGDGHPVLEVEYQRRIH